MILLKTLLLLLIIGVTGNFQDTTSNNPYCPKRAQKDFSNCYSKQEKINNMVIEANFKLDSIEFKWDRLLELIRNDTIQ